MAAAKFWCQGVIRRTLRLAVISALIGLPLLSMSAEELGTDIPANAAEDVLIQHIEGYLRRLDSMDSSFEQSVHGAYGELIEYASGRFTLARPKFRWSVDAPYPQDIVSDGEVLSIYDPDLEQVTRRATDEALAGTPLGLLTRNEFDLSASYSASQVLDEVERYVLTSLDEEAPFRQIQLWIEDDVLRRIEVLDHFDQRLSVIFTQDVLPEWPADPFQLELPDGVEVVQG